MKLRQGMATSLILSALVVSLPGCLMKSKLSEYGGANFSNSPTGAGTGSILGSGSSGSGDGSTDAAAAANAGGVVRNIAATDLTLKVPASIQSKLTPSQTVVQLEMALPKAAADDSDLLLIRRWGPFDDPGVFIDRASMGNISCARDPSVALVGTLPPTTLIDRQTIGGNTISIPPASSFNVVEKGQFYIYVFCAGFEEPNQPGVYRWPQVQTQVILTNNPDGASDSVGSNLQTIGAVNPKIAFHECNMAHDPAHLSRRFTLSFRPSKTVSTAAANYDLTNDDDVMSAIEVRMFTDKADRVPLVVFKTGTDIDAAGGGVLDVPDSMISFKNKVSLSTVGPDSARAIISAIRSNNAATTDVNVDFWSNTSSSINTYMNSYSGAKIGNFYKGEAPNMYAGVELVIKTRVPAGTDASAADFTQSKALESFLQYYNDLITNNSTAGAGQKYLERFDYIRAASKLLTAGSAGDCH